MEKKMEPTIMGLGGLKGLGVWGLRVEGLEL